MFRTTGPVGPILPLSPCKPAGPWKQESGLISVWTPSSASKTVMVCSLLEVQEHPSDQEYQMHPENHKKTSQKDAVFYHLDSDHQVFTIPLLQQLQTRLVAQGVQNVPVRFEFRSRFSHKKENHFLKSQDLLWGLSVLDDLGFLGILLHPEIKFLIWINDHDQHYCN